MEQDAAGVNTSKERESLFWKNCIPMRLALASAMVIASLHQVWELQVVLAVYMGSWGVGFLFNFLVALQEPRLEAKRQRATDPNEIASLDRRLLRIRYGNFGGRVWWQWPRLVHGILLLCYSVGTFVRMRDAHVFAIADVAFGVLAGFYYYRLRKMCEIQCG